MAKCIDGVECRPIPGFRGYYAGADGSIWSFRRRNARKLTPAVNGHGYMNVGLRRSDGRAATVSQHRCVLSAFRGQRPEGKECGHRNGNPSDNRLANLEWIDRRTNWSDKRKHGTACEGDRSHMSKLSSGDVLAVMAMLNRGQSHRKIALRFGVTPQAIYNIAHGKCWKSLTGR